MRIVNLLHTSNDCESSPCSNPLCVQWRKRSRDVAAWIADEDGTTAVEYAVMVAAIAVFVFVSVGLMTQAAEENFTATADAIAGT